MLLHVDRTCVPAPLMTACRCPPSACTAGGPGDGQSSSLRSVRRGALSQGPVPVLSWVPALSQLWGTLWPPKGQAGIACTRRPRRDTPHCWLPRVLPNTPASEVPPCVPSMSAAGACWVLRAVSTCAPVGLCVAAAAPVLPGPRPTPPRLEGPPWAPGRSRHAGAPGKAATNYVTLMYVNTCPGFI